MVESFRNLKAQFWARKSVLKIKMSRNKKNKMRSGNMLKHGTLRVFPFLHVACYPADRETVTIFFWLALPASLSTIPCRSYALSLTTAQPSAPTKTAYDLPTCLVHMLSLVSSWRFPAILSSQQKQLICWWAMVQESNVFFLLLRLACNMSFFVIAADPELQKKSTSLCTFEFPFHRWFCQNDSRRNRHRELTASKDQTFWVSMQMRSTI